MIRTFAAAIFALLAVAAPARADDFALQTKCADAARQWVANQNRSDPLPANSHFENHYSIKLQKCFMRLFEGPDFTQSPQGFIRIFVLDAVEGKEYAEFNGYQLCIPQVDKDPHCSLNSGSIWFDGNRERNPSDIQLGFGGLPSGKFGNADTESEFISATDKYFMAN
jgi:hypothetical protein